IQYTVYSTHGTGFIALAALISGRWHPFGVLVTSVLFGFSQILNVYATSVELLKHLPIELFSALPYALTVVVLLLFGGRGEAPRAIGQPYDRARRY
ncbi:ABC transporter permease, partial [Treponema pallidum]